MTETASEPSPRRSSSPGRFSSPKRFSIAHLILVIPWVALVIDAWAPIRDNSFLWHVRAGSLQAEAGRVLTEDPFSFTMFGTPWRTQSWLAELAYGWGESLWELGFVPPMLLTATTVAFAGIGLISYRYSRSVPATALLLILSTVLMLSFLVPRPVIFSFALFTLVILAWGSPKTRWAVPLLFWIWASVHGSFVIGLAHVGLSILVEKEWKSLPTVIVSGLVTLTTAHGLGVVGMLFDFLEAREALSLLVEWRPPEPISVTFTPFLLGVLLLVIGAARGRIETRHLMLIAPFLLLGFSSTRAIPPAWIGLVPLIALGMAGLGSRLRGRFSRPSAVVFVAVVLVLPFLVAGDGTLDEERFPIVAAGHLTDVPTFHDDRAGGYLIWAEGPGRLVYIDDRAELYRERMAEFVEVRNGDIPWQPVFERDEISQVLLREEEGLVAEVTNAGWTVAYRDEHYVVLRP